ncbi:hypothetical protein [Lactococcus sp. DD01]|uniref:hypothetical protein n=1 Tax=Lactococcus sp. DD01 TaxID=1776443 RepID=UPI000776AB81|nr:hypothetical protein [Lactococcus sp. DD01]KXT59422.1 hypothetical protein LACDD01_02077 [Lactococcus sp. DD01]
METNIFDYTKLSGLTSDKSFKGLSDKFSVFENQLSSFSQPQFPNIGLSNEEKIKLRKLFENDITQ